jgi:hypothetical protein
VESRQYGGLNYLPVCGVGVNVLSANINIVNNKVKMSLQTSYESHLEVYTSIDKTGCIITYTKILQRSYSI